MCGIAGYISAHAPIEAATLRAMRDTLEHRGPDGHGLWRSDSGDVGLAHRRLAIIDLTEGGHQPMVSRDERFVITFNGEIYNHHELRDELAQAGWTFTSSSDTEVLLAAWERWNEDALERLDGMFAFAIWDRKERVLHAARDRAGEKPFFFHRTERGLMFSSELKALLAHPDVPRRVSVEAMDHFLAYGYVPRGLCMFEGFAKLPAGHKLRYDLASDNLAISPYWMLPQYQEGQRRSFHELAEEFEPLLDTSVRRQMLADVPVGILLSGGLDSSLVAEAATRVTSNVTTFTIGFPGHGQLDESPIARRLACELGTNHVELMAEPGTVELLPELAAQYDEPIADSSMIPTFLVSKLVRARATVALGGDGGDELFGGYPHHSWVRRLEAARRAGLHRLPLASAAARALPLEFMGRKMALRLTDRFDPAITVTRFAEPELRRKLIGNRHNPPHAAAETMRRDLIGPWRDAGERAMALDFLTYMCDDILVKVDRASMLTSLELRAPLLNRAIIEFAFGRLAPDQRATSSGRKLLLRHVARRRLPAWFDSHRKQGFSIPLATWLKGPWASLLEDLADDSGEGLLQPRAVRRFLRTGGGSERMAHQVYQLAMLELWRRHYGVSWG